MWAQCTTAHIQCSVAVVAAAGIRYSPRLCDMILGLTKSMFPKFSKTVLLARREGYFFVPLFDALAAVRKTFRDEHVAFSTEQLQLTDGTVGATLARSQQPRDVVPLNKLPPSLPT